MKYKTFRALVLAGVFCSGAGFLYWFFGGSDRPDNRRPVASGSPSRQRARRASEPSAGPGAFSALDRRIFDRIRQGIRGSKAKDVFRGEGVKVNLYAEAGRSGVGRVKIDLDRDGKWDEKWSFEMRAGVKIWKRKVSPADDGASYPRKFQLRRGAWAPE